MRQVLATAAVILLGLPAIGVAQPVAGISDTLRLGALQADAVRRDPRAAQLELLASQSALRLRSLDVERLPQPAVRAMGQYQSEVITIPFQLPGGGPVPGPPRDSYDANLALTQRLFDPTRGPRREVERARLAESQARVRSSLFALRQSVNDAYFAALLLRSERAEVESAIADMEAQLAVAADRVRLGSALPSEAATLEAELLGRRRAISELDANMSAAMEVLGDLTGRTLTAPAELAVPELGAAVLRARAALGELRARPEYEQFARSRELLAVQEESVAALDRPRVSAFGRAGLGRPGLNPLARDLTDYWVAGVQVEWTPWSWGTSAREREELEVQQQIVSTEAVAFSRSIWRGAANDIAAITSLEASAATDDEIVELRERILREARFRFAEGVITSAEYVDREGGLLAARIARATHRIQLAQASARFLTLVGLELP